MNSPYVDYIRLTNKHSGIRTQKVQAFVLHHMAGVMTGKECAEYFQRTTRSCSSNYCIGPNGDVAMNVEEKNRAWTSSSNWADQRAITFELSNSKYGHPWAVSDTAIRKVILMLAEMHKRYGLKKCTYTGDTRGTLWRHDFFANTNCPGPYLAGKLPFIADEVNKILNNNSAKPTAPTQPKPQTSATIKVGDTVSITGTKYSTGQTIPGWVKAKKHIVAKIDGSKALLGHPNGINSWVDIKDLKNHTPAKSATFKPYTVKVAISELNIRTGAGTGYKASGYINPGVYTIVEEAAGAGATKWGKLKSGAGWISLDYAKKV